MSFTAMYHHVTCSCVPFPFRIVERNNTLLTNKSLVFESMPLFIDIWCGIGSGFGKIPNHSNLQVMTFIILEKFQRGSEVLVKRVRTNVTANNYKSLILCYLFSKSLIKFHAGFAQKKDSEFSMNSQRNA